MFPFAILLRNINATKFKITLYMKICAANICAQI